MQSDSSLDVRRHCATILLQRGYKSANKELWRIYEHKESRTGDRDKGENHILRSIALATFAKSGSERALKEMLRKGELRATGARKNVEIPERFFDSGGKTKEWFRENVELLQWDIYRKMFVARPPRNTD
jgi:hypothetical protein